MALYTGDITSITYSLRPLTQMFYTAHSGVLADQDLFTLLFYKSLCKTNFDSEALSLSRSRKDKTITLTVHDHNLEIRIMKVLEELRNAMEGVFCETEESTVITILNKSLFASYIQPALLKISKHFNLNCNIEESDGLSEISNEVTLTILQSEESEDDLSSQNSRKRKTASLNFSSPTDDESTLDSLYSEIISDNDCDVVDSKPIAAAPDKKISTRIEKKVIPLFSTKIIPISSQSKTIQPASSFIPKIIKTSKTGKRTFDATNFDYAGLVERCLYYRDNFDISPNFRKHIGYKINLLTRATCLEIISLISKKPPSHFQTKELSETSIFFDGEAYHVPLHRVEISANSHEITFLKANSASKVTYRSTKLFLKKV